MAVAAGPAGDCCCRSSCSTRSSTRRATNWVGLVTRKPVTEDFVPLLPWLGVMLWGLAAGQWLLRRRPGWLAGAVPAALAPLAALGRWPLTFYMLHQPILIGLLLMYRAVAA